MSAYAAIAILLLMVFLTGSTIGVFLIVSWAYNQEDRKRSLKGPPPGIGCDGARRLTGVGRRDITPDRHSEQVNTWPGQGWGQGR
jgi:hypothetical protein